MEAGIAPHGYTASDYASLVEGLFGKAVPEPVDSWRYGRVLCQHLYRILGNKMSPIVLQKANRTNNSARYSVLNPRIIRPK